MSVTIHQSLHGYGDGHQLLAISTEIDDYSSTELLIQSDLSGSSFVQEFDAYLTAYRLAKSGLYVLARTWFAPEMPRPGCVWTHSLLISDHDLPRIRDFMGLLGLLRRPVQQEFDEYRTPLTYEPSPIPNETGGGPYLRALVHGLYSTHSTLLIPARGSAETEKTLISLLSQQWPKLRRNFKFCTGALIPRARGFDVLASPKHSIAALVDEDVLVISTSTPSAPWIETVAADIERPSAESDLRKFLWTYGPEFADGRSTFRFLVELHSSIQPSPIDIDSVLALTARYLPSEDVGVRLKTQLFGPSGLIAERTGKDGPLTLSIATSPNGACLSPNVARMRDRAASLFGSDRRQALRIGEQCLELKTAHGIGYLDGLGLELIEHPEVFQECSQSLLDAVVGARPQVLEMPSFWRDDSLRMTSMARRLLTSTRPESEAVLDAIISAGAEAALTTLINARGAEGPASILRWCDRSAANTSVLRVPPPISTLLENRLPAPNTALSLFGVPARKVCASFLEVPNQTSDLSIWVDVAESTLVLDPQELEFRANSFLFRMGFQNNTTHSFSLVALAFPRIYRALMARHVNDGDWDTLKRPLPYFYPDWDRCGRMVRAVARLCVQRDWSPKRFVALFGPLDAMERGAEEASDAWGGTRYLRGLVEAHERNEIRLEGSWLERVREQL